MSEYATRRSSSSIHCRRRRPTHLIGRQHLARSRIASGQLSTDRSESSSNLAARHGAGQPDQIVLRPVLCLHGGLPSYIAYCQPDGAVQRLVLLACSRARLHAVLSTPGADCMPHRPGQNQHRPNTHQAPTDRSVEVIGPRRQMARSRTEYRF